MRFGFWPSPWLPFNEMVELCTHAEATGWDGLWLADHFMSAGANADMPFPEAWITLAALAARVPRVRVGTMVTGNTYRHPAVLAKMAATLDHISGGRVVLGLGSGWQEKRTPAVRYRVRHDPWPTPAAGRGVPSHQGVMYGEDQQLFGPLLSTHGCDAGAEARGRTPCRS